MPEYTAAELRGQLESNTLALNACRVTLQDLRRDRDFPHSNNKYLADAEKRIAQLAEEMATAVKCRDKLIERTNLAMLASRIEEEQLRHQALDTRRNVIISSLALASATEATTKAVKPHLNKLEDLTAKLLSLPQADMAAILAKLLAQSGVPANETQADDTGRTVAVPAGSESGESSAEPGTDSSGVP